MKDTTQELANVGREFYRRGWVLGTSGNFSAVASREPLSMMITASGNEKGELADEHFLEVGEGGTVVAGDGRPSAETSLHLTIYRMRPAAGAVLHTHSVWGTILSDAFYDRGAITIAGYEMLKGLADVVTHDHSERVPIIENSQDYVALSAAVEHILRDDDSLHGIYLRRHGLYTWGHNVAEAKRHIEIFEFLFEVLGRSIK